MDEQIKYEVIKSLVDHSETGNKDRAALKLGCTRRHINRMIAGYLKEGKTFFVHDNKGRKPSTNIADDVRYLPTKRKMSHRTMRTLTHSSLMPANSSVWNLNPAAFHRPKAVWNV